MRIGLSLLLIIGTGYSPVLAQETIAKLLIDKGLARISVEARKNVTSDIISRKEEYDNKDAYNNNVRKSSKTSKKTITGRPKLGYLDIDDMYEAFTTRFDFTIDNNNSTGVINGNRYVLIKFSPKPHLTNKTVTDAFINHTSGTVYMNLDNFEFVRVEGGISDHFLTTWKTWWSPISFDIDVYEFNFSIDYTVFNGIVIEQNLEGMVDYEIRNRGIEKHTYALSNYRIR